MRPVYRSVLFRYTMPLLKYWGRNTPEWWEDYHPHKWTVNTGPAQSVKNMKASISVLINNDIPVRGQKCLDIGCALGEGTEILRVEGAFPVGADFSANAIKHCRQTYPNLRFEQWDIREVPEDFDIIITNHTIEHLGHDSQRALRHLASKCKILLMNAPCSDFNPDADDVHTGKVSTAVKDFPPALSHGHNIHVWK